MVKSRLFFISWKVNWQPNQPNKMWLPELRWQMGSVLSWLLLLPVINRNDELSCYSVKMASLDFPRIFHNCHNCGGKTSLKNKVGWLSYCSMPKSLACIHYLNPFPNKPLLLCICQTCLLKTLWEKEKLLVKSNFSFSHSIFYPFGKLFTIFMKLKIVVYKLFQIGKV